MCLMVAWQPIKAAVKRPLIDCTTAPVGVAPVDYHKHLGCVHHIQLSHLECRICVYPRVSWRHNAASRFAAEVLMRHDAFELDIMAVIEAEKFRFAVAILIVMGNWVPQAAGVADQDRCSAADIERFSCEDTVGLSLPVSRHAIQ